MSMWREPMTYVAAALIVAAFVVAGYIILVSASRQLSQLENTLFQIFILAAGISGSFMFGRKAARELIRPHARSAFRRVFSMNRSLRRMSSMIEEMKQESPDRRLDMIQFLVEEQIWTGRDSLADWRDIIPKDIAEIEKAEESDRRRADNDNRS